jgi:hypothetical protein
MASCVATLVASARSAASPRPPLAARGRAGDARGASRGSSSRPLARRASDRSRLAAAGEHADDAPPDESAFGAEPWSGAPGEDPISNEVLLKIVLSQIPDEEVNRLVWECLGYTKSIDMDAETLEVKEVWSPENVFPKWAAAYPEPPDVIGVTRKYFPEVDAPVKAACAALTRSVAQEHKQGIKTTLKHLGWKGYKMDGLTPNMTRRAQAANWLLYYRRELRGVSIEELKRRRAERAAAEEAAGRTDAPTGTTKTGVV